MKRQLPVAFVAMIIILFVSACGSGSSDEGYTMPADLADKKAELIKRQQEFAELKNYIQNLQDSIEILDPSEKVSKAVYVQKLDNEPFQSFAEITGSIEPVDVVNASSEIGGRVMSLTVKEGDAVSQNQLIARLDDSALRSQIDQLNSSLSLAKDVYDRQSKLWKQNIGTEIQYLQAQNQVEQIETQIASINISLQKLNVHAPKTGIVERLYVKQGEFAGPGAPIAEILNTSRVKLTAQIPESYLGKVGRRDRVKVEIPALEKEMNVTITDVSRTIDPSNRTFKVESEISSNNGTLKPNLLTKFFIKDESYQSAIVIPMAYVQRDLGGDAFVMVAQPEGDGYLAVKKIIQTGSEYDGNIVVTDGLVPEDILILDGSIGLSDHAPVSIQFKKDKDQ